MAYIDKNFGLNAAVTYNRHQEWSYLTTDPVATCTAPNFFATAKKRGVKIGDSVRIQVVDDVAVPTTVIAVAERIFVLIAPGGAGTANATMV